jgi:hypothetical protein
MTLVEGRQPSADEVVGISHERQKTLQRLTCSP